MLDNKICILREQLYSLISTNANYSEILEISIELDKVIAEFIYKDIEIKKSQPAEVCD